MPNNRELIIAVLVNHYMTSSSRSDKKTGIRTSERHCGACHHELPWRDWERPLLEHQADVLVERLGL